MPQYSAYSDDQGGDRHVFTVALAAELGNRGITVNTLAPGLTATDMNAATRSQPRALERAYASR